MNHISFHCDQKYSSHVAVMEKDNEKVKGAYVYFTHIDTFFL